jgi:hypothetical protein
LFAEPLDSVWTCIVLDMFVYLITCFFFDRMVLLPR